MTKILNNVLMRLSDNDELNKRLFINEYGTINYTDDDGNNLCHLLFRPNMTFNVDKRIKALKLLLDCGIDPNDKNALGNTFMHLVTCCDFNVAQIVEILSIACNHGFDINVKNQDGFTILHFFLLSHTNANTVLCIMQSLKILGFDFEATDRYGRNFEHAIDSIRRFNYDDINRIKAMLEDCRSDFFTEDSLDAIIDAVNGLEKDDASKKNGELGIKLLLGSNIEKPRIINEEKVKSSKIPYPSKIKTYGTILTEKKYDYPPAYGRETEVRKLMLTLATDKKLPLLVGPSGVGKTTIVDQLAYLIVNEQVPRYLNGKNIYEVYMDDIISGTNLRGDFERNMQELVSMALKNNLILFIDEFHTVFGAGAGMHDKVDAATMLRKYIDRSGLQIIGATTTNEYQLYMANGALKRRFEVIKVAELQGDNLFIAIYYSILNIANKKELGISTTFSDHLEEIINILMELTTDIHRQYDDKICNPDLVLGIVDRAFAYALCCDDDELNVQHLLLAIDDCERITDSAKKTASNRLNTLSEKKALTRTKTIAFTDAAKIVPFR